MVLCSFQSGCLAGEEDGSVSSSVIACKYHSANTSSCVAAREHDAILPRGVRMLSVNTTADHGGVRSSAKYTVEEHESAHLNGERANTTLIIPAARIDLHEVASAKRNAGATLIWTVNRERHKHPLRRRKLHQQRVLA